MALNPLYSLLPLSFVAGGLSAIIFWHFTHRMDRKVIGWAALAWLASYVSMVLVEIFVRLFFYLPEAVQPIYFGLSAAVFHVFVPLFVLSRKTKIFKRSPERIGFGVSYAGIELVFIGMISVIFFNLMLSSPDFVGSVPIEELAVFSFDNLYYISWSPLLFLQAISVVILYVLTVTLLFKYIDTRGVRWLAFAFLFESSINLVVNYIPEHAEFFHISCGLAVSALLWRYREKFWKARRARNPKKK